MTSPASLPILAGMMRRWRGSVEERKETLMNPSMYAHEPGTTTTYSEANVTEMDVLSQWGFTTEEITSLLWLRQWYQNGGSDRATIVRHLEFLRLLVRNGELEL